MRQIEGLAIQPGMLLQQRYRVTQQLGKGGFGATFEVDDCGKPKVLKVLVTNYPKAVSLFQREAEVLSQLHHPGIPKVEPDSYFTFCSKENDLLHCLVMEKIDGLNLQEWLKLNKNQPITQEQAANWLKKLAEILDKIHQQQYFHRDIKPANIMLKPDGQLVLIDFGAVREVTETYLEKLDGKQITGINSPGYTPPEQSDGSAVLQSDFFALGRTFVHLLTGKHPLEFSKDLQTGELNWKADAPQITEDFAQLIENLMATFPGQRPQNSQVILQRLRGELFSCITESTENYQNIATKQAWHGKRPLIRFGFAALFLLGICGWRFGLPRIAIAYNDRGVEHYLAEQSNQALLDFNIAVKLDPNFAEAYYNRGMIYENLRDFDRARMEYQIAAKGGISEAYNNLARLYILQKNYVAAVDLIGQGMKQTKLNKEMKYVLYKNLGWARLEQNRYVEAKKHLQMAINEDRDRAAAYCLLAQVLEAQGDMKGALVKWKSCRQYAFQYNPDEDTWMGMADKRLAAGEKK